jgi:two-component system response regulator NreC
MDMDMPEHNGLEATRQIKVDFPRVHVIVLTMHGGERIIQQMLKAGASGYLLKDCAFDELVKAIRRVLEGRIYLAEQVSNVVMKDYVQRLESDPADPTAKLSPREREVLQLLADGQSARQIADQLFVSVKTVETQCKNLMKRLDLGSLTELTKFAIREGITTTERRSDA